jgi:hypothetical protein
LAELRTTATLPERGIAAPLPLRKTATAPTRSPFPVTGNWQLRVYLRTDDIDAYSAKAGLTVR